MGKKNRKSKKDIQDYFNVSMATVDNWMKTGVIPKIEHNEISSEEFQTIVEYIISNNTHKLRGRANRSMIDESLVCYLGIDEPKIKRELLKAVRLFKRLELTIEESIYSICVQALNEKNLINSNWLSNPKTKIELFLLAWAKESRIDIQSCQVHFATIHIEADNEDFIGAFYQSIQSVSSKSKNGSYYTPRKLLRDITIPCDRTVLDPCCGSGSILLKVLTKKHNDQQVYAWDIDEIALKICRVNLCIFFNNPNSNPNIKRNDIVFGGDSVSVVGAELAKADACKFDFIITNPPWGSKFTKQEKDLLFNRYHVLETSESFSIVLYNSMNMLSEDGKLLFFLPYSFLNVATHRGIRRYLTEKRYHLFVVLLGNAFPGVMSEAIRIELCKSTDKQEEDGNEKNKEPYIRIGSTAEILYSKIEYKMLQGLDYIIPATATEADVKVIEKVYKMNHIVLKNNAVFALGIVTGNNQKHILEEATSLSEPIFRGKDIRPYFFSKPERFIEFEPTLYQQVAPEKIYRQLKIVYKFISNRIVCVLDNDNRLLLNSANVLIPINGYPIETIIVLFNSKLYSFLYRKLYYSKKVLRSHLESFPLPIVDRTVHDAIKTMYNHYIAGKIKLSEIDTTIYSLFSLTDEDVTSIENECRWDN